MGLIMKGEVTHPNSLYRVRGYTQWISISLKGNLKFLIFIYIQFCNRSNIKGDNSSQIVFSLSEHVNTVTFHLACQISVGKLRRH